MQAIALVLLLFAADPPAAEKPSLPDNYRAYFERAEKNKAAFVKTEEETLEHNEGIWRIAAKDRKPRLRREIVRQKDYLEEVRRRTSWSHLPDPPRLMDIGTLPSSRIVAILNDTTVLVRRGDEQFYVIKVPSTKSLQNTINRPWDIGGKVWVVTDADGTKDDRIAREIAKSKVAATSAVVIEEIQPVDLSKYRAIYEAEKKAKVSEIPAADK